MLFRLLITAQLLQFCLSSYVTDIYWPHSINGYYRNPVMRYLSKTAEKVNNKLLALLPMLPPSYRAITPTEVVDVVPVTVEPSSTVIAQQPNSTAKLAAFEVSSAKATPVTVPASVIITSSGDAQDDENYMLAREKKMEIYGIGKQYSNEVFKRRVIKMAVAPSYASEVKNPNAANTNYQSEVAEQKPHEAEQYNFEKKQR